jgi:hypothetical protein
LATAAAGATITTLGFAAMGTAGAAQVTDVVNNNASGYAAGNILAPSIIDTSSTWNFRYASGTTTVPDVSTGNPVLNVNLARQYFSVQLSNTKVTFAAQLHSTGTTATVQFLEYVRPTGTLTPTPAACTYTWLAGDQARLDVFYSQDTGMITFTAYDGPDVVCTSTMPAWSAASLGGGSFREAYVGGVFIAGGDPYTDATTAWVRPSAVPLGTDTKLFAVTGVRFTSYNGTMGTVSGPWTYRQLIFGTGPSNVYVSSPVLWNGGSNFGVWVRV